MTSITILLAVIMSALVCLLPPVYALAAMIVSLLYYPTYLVVQLGVFDISVLRIVVSFFLFRCLLSSRQRARFRWNVLDTLVCVNMAIWFIIPLLFYGWPTSKVLEHRSGLMMDTLFVYFVCRFCLWDPDGLSRFVKVLPYLLLPLALLGLFESITGNQPYAVLMKYCPWENPGTGVWAPRMGLMRAVGSAGHPIMFGILFVMFIPLFRSLKELYPGNIGRHWFCLGILLAGCFSSMSSGPWMMAVLVLFFFFLEKKKVWIKPLIGLFIFAILFVAILSNRPFYHVFFSYLNPVGGTAWHRAKLMELTIHHFPEWVLYGYGGRDPGWGPELGARWTDITNHFISIAVEYGFIGLLAFIGLFVCSIRRLRKVYGSVRSRFVQTLCWSYESLLVMLLLTLNSCTLFDQTRTLLFFQFGIIGSILQMKTLFPPERAVPSKRMR